MIWIMKKALRSFITVAVGILVTVPLQAGVTVTAAPEPLEKVVALRTPAGKYVTTASGGLLHFSGEKIGSKQTFTLVDLNGTDLADGDPVKVRYTPGGQTKSNYWMETPAGIKRNSEGSVFKIKKVETKYAIQGPSGKFVTEVITDGLVTLSDKQADALLLELVDLSGGVPKAPKKPKAPAAATPAPEKPATE